MCSISGLVSTTLACLRAHARSSVGGVAVVGDRAQAGHEPRAQRAELVLGERLGREHEQRGVALAVDDRLDDRHLVAERLARRGAGRDHDAARRRGARRSPAAWCDHSASTPACRAGGSRRRG